MGKCKELGRQLKKNKNKILQTFLVHGVEEQDDRRDFG